MTTASVTELIEQARDALNTLFGNTDIAYSGSHSAHRDGHAALDGLEEQTNSFRRVLHAIAVSHGDYGRELARAALNEVDR